MAEDGFHRPLPARDDRRSRRTLVDNDELPVDFVTRAIGDKVAIKAGGEFVARFILEIPVHRSTASRAESVVMCLPETGKNSTWLAREARAARKGFGNTRRPLTFVVMSVMVAEAVDDVFPLASPVNTPIV